MRRTDQLTMPPVFRLASWIFGETLVRPLHLLCGGSVVRLFKRLKRIRGIAGSMVHGDLMPPMPMRLQIETTDSCNLKCRMCTREVLSGMNSSSMSFEKFQSIIEETDPYYVTLNGLGEPLIDRTIFKKLAFLRERCVVTSMPTNGTYIRRQNLSGLADNLPDLLHFSIDGATKESFEYVRVASNFDEIIANYRALLDLKARSMTRRGAKIAIICALQKGNLFDFRAMFKLVQSMPGIDSFDLVPVFDYDHEGKTFSYLIPSHEDVVAVHRQLERAMDETEDPTEKAFYEQWKRVSSVWLASPPAERSDQTCGHFCMIPWFNSYVDAKGRVYPCCYLLNSDHIMGNIHERPFREVWAGETYRNFRLRLMNDRSNLNGCRSCPRNDDSPLSKLTYLKRLLPVPCAKKGRRVL